MFSIVVFLTYLIFLPIQILTIDIIEQNFSNSIEKLLLIKDNLYLGTSHSLHRLSSLTLNQTLNTFEFDDNTHLKILLSLPNEQILLCGTSNQGLCQIIDQNFNIIVNSSLPIVANDPINSTIALIIPEKDLIYFGVTYTNEGIQRWQIPSISGRSLNLSRFMKIVSINDNDEMISRDDLALRFMSRQQTTFIVQYIYSFYTKNYIYFITNQPYDLGHTNFLTKIVRFCRDSTYSIIRTYTEIPLVCVNSEWILKTADISSDKNNKQILIGHFTRKDGTGGTNICSWNIENDIDQAFEDNYRTCYSMGNGQRGLAFIKPNEPCRKDETWSIPMNNDNICPWIISDRLPYPVGGATPVIGRTLYENLMESSTVLKMYSFDSLTKLVFQGLTNGTFKLGLFDFGKNINWFYSYQLSSQLPILSDVIYDKKLATFFLASGSKIYRLSFSSDCTSRLSCDECLSSSNNPLCGWCTINERCTLVNDCPSNSWQQESNQCTHIVNVHPLKASVDHSQWINLTLSKLPQLEHNEIYQCIFMDKIMSANTQAIKLDHNRLSCPTPSNKNLQLHKGTPSTVRLSVVKWPSNTSIATVPEFTFYNCSSYFSCATCRAQIGCQWCSQRCSSMCTESITQCPIANLLDPSNIFLESSQSASIPFKFDSIQFDNPIECRLNETIHGLINSDGVCQISKVPEIISQNEEKIILSLYQNDILIGMPMEMFIYRCNLYDSCDQCNSRSKCSWCQGQCSSKLINKCLTNEQCTSVYIKDFSPKIISIYGQTLIRIFLNEDLKESIKEILLADIPCVLINSSNVIQCQAQSSNSSRKGRISIRFSNSIYILSKDIIEYRQSSIVSINPTIAYQFGGQIFHIHGENLFIGNEQRIFIGNYPCKKIKQTLRNSLSCHLPSISPGMYNITIKIDDQMINTEQKLKITPNPIVQDIDPTISFASGGRLITVRGMYFESIQIITVKFSYKKWNAKLRINSNDLISTDDGLISSFYFRTPGIPSTSDEFPLPPMDVNFSLDFDDSIISLPNLIQFRYIPDVLLNVSSTPQTLPYTGEELKLQVENLTEAASMTDIQLFIGCSECKLRTFTSKGITCQPPAKLSINPAIILNNQQRQDDCTLFNSSIGPIRFRIGYREYLIGYLSYTRSLSSKYSLMTIIALISTSCLVTIALLSLSLYLFYKYRKTKSVTNSLTLRKNTEQNEKQCWSTDTSASTGPYYQVYEQVSCLSSHENTLTRGTLLSSCPYHQEKRITPPIMEQLQMSLSFLTTLSVDNEQLKKLLLFTEPTFSSIHYRPSMELFYDLLHMEPFSQAFIEKLIENNSLDLIQAYVYLFRYTPSNFHSFNSFFQFFSTLFLQNKNDLIHKFHFFDDFLRILIDSIDSSPCDEILQRSSRSISSSTLLLYNLQYHSYQLTIDYENFLRFHLPVLDCDTINQVKQKIIRYLNSYENTYRLIEYDQLDLLLPSLSHCTCVYQIPMIKNYLINSTIYCQKKSLNRNEKNVYSYHLCSDNQMNNDRKLMEEKLVENKNRLQQILIYFYQQIANGLDLFDIWTNDFKCDLLFQQYIRLVSELIRRLNRLMLCRSTCPIIESCLNVVADGLEFIFDTKTDFSPDIEFLFAEEKKHFASVEKTNFHIRSSNQYNPQLSSKDIRSLVLDDDQAIECLYKLYQFYELNCEPINQHIGENHVSVLLPIHHLLVRIRQLLQSDKQTLI
ncbi:hypothetical protein I4U23_014945 [Adineta vaga]|nr:hypothetical protein I4U23_014945 [Adineta vaga]